MRLTGPQYLSPGTMNEHASFAAALPAHAWGSKHAVTHLLLCGDKGHCLESLTHPWQVLPWCLLLEETQGKKRGVELVLKKLKIICEKNPKLAPSNFSYLSIYINGNNNIEIIYQKV